MLFEFLMNFVNTCIEKNKIKKIFFSTFKVFFAFHAISNIEENNEKKKIGVKKKSGGGRECGLFST